MNKLNENNKIVSILGLCKKSGNLTFGYDSCIDSINKKKSKLILVANDLSYNTKQKLYNKINIDECNLICLTNFSINDIGNILGKSCGIISVNNTGFAEKIKSILNF